MEIYFENYRTLKHKGLWCVFYIRGHTWGVLIKPVCPQCGGRSVGPERYFEERCALCQGNDVVSWPRWVWYTLVSALWQGYTSPRARFIKWRQAHKR